MAKDPAFLFYPGDYLRDTQCLSEKTQVAYDRIMCEHMRNICISQQQLNFFTKRLTDSEKEELMSVLTQVNGGFQIEWVALSIENRRAYSDSRRKNRAGKSKEHMNNISSIYVKHMENEDEDVNENKNLLVRGGAGGENLFSEERAMVQKMFLTLFSVQPTAYDYGKTENLIKQFGAERVREAFRISRDAGKEKAVYAYILGILNNNGEKNGTNSSTKNITGNANGGRGIKGVYQHQYRGVKSDAEIRSDLSKVYGT